MLPASVVPMTLPAKPDLAVVTAFPDPADPYPWADPAMRRALANLPRPLRERVAALGEPRNILSCAADDCHTPLILLYNRRHFILHAGKFDERGVTVWCPACDLPRVYIGR